MAVGLGIAVSTIAAYYSIRYVKKKRMIREYKLNGPTYHNVKRRVATVFNNKRTLYYLLVGLSSEVDKDVIKKVKDQVPQEIYAYKFLFNPVRLAYMHLLFAFDRLTSKEIKEQLGLSWNDFTNTSKLLQEKGYIRTETGIFDGKLQQVVTIEELGREDFSTLIALLEKLIHETKSFENYLSSFTFDLYPEN